MQKTPRKIFLRLVNRHTMSHDGKSSKHDDHDGHDSYDENGYKKRCYCEKCKRKYDEWCRRQKESGHKTCKRKCFTICEVKCEQPKYILDKWGYKKEYEGKWEPFHDKEPKPKHCDRCKKEKKDCSCRKQKKDRKDDSKKGDNAY